jgi:protease-4
MYGRFVSAVAEGRAITKDEVDAVGRGHVWSGTQALPIKLVDKFGGLGDALDEAKRRMGIGSTAKIQIVELPAVPSTLLGAIGKLFGAEAEASLSLTDLPVIRDLLRGVPASVLVAPGVPHTRLPFDIVWE